VISAQARQKKAMISGIFRGGGVQSKAAAVSKERDRHGKKKPPPKGRLF
jgi:hypothetical protein